MAKRVEYNPMSYGAYFVASVHALQKKFDDSRFIRNGEVGFVYKAGVVNPATGNKRPLTHDEAEVCAAK